MRSVLVSTLATIAFSLAACRTASPPAPGGETVILIHGMGRSTAAMAILARRLELAGYHSVNFGYDAGDEDLDTLSRRLLDRIEREVIVQPGHTPYHVVGHSLGNIIARNAFRFGYPKNAGGGLATMVMLAPPNRPALLAKKLADNRLYRWLNGEPGQRLADPGFYATLPVPTVPFGVIAGSKGQSLTFAEPNDGIVAVDATRLDGMRDWIVLDHTHTFLMNGSDTFEQVVHFIQHQTFQR